MAIFEFDAGPGFGRARQRMGKGTHGRTLDAMIATSGWRKASPNEALARVLAAGGAGRPAHVGARLCSETDMAAMALWSYSCRSRIIMAEDKTKIATLPGTWMLTVLRFCETEAARREAGSTGMRSAAEDLKLLNPSSRYQGSLPHNPSSTHAVVSSLEVQYLHAQQSQYLHMPSSHDHARHSSRRQH